MLYNPLLNTFIAVADSGSFNKAAEKLYISPTAVMKQINSLEDVLDLTLVERKSQGVFLTEIGKKIYSDAKFMIDYSEKSISAASVMKSAFETTFCVGTSMLNPAKPFMDLWYKVNKDFSDYKLHLIPFDDSHDGIVSEISKLGVKFDFLIGVCDSKVWSNVCNFLPLGRYKKMVAVRQSHPLATKKSLQISDLYGYTLMMVKEGDSGVNDFLRNDLTSNHSQIAIEDTPPFYDASVFNRCAETDNILLNIECWKDIHPALVTIPVQWDYSIPYGIMYALNPTDDVKHFIELVMKISSVDDKLHK
ncbi:LysR family transcriptional regulator [Chakrabartyella piscis]|uniref:LysR family transcriptional regulator n=1 Tax=Chakrabartyella piscis TaxID=2918914 RepID=UPI0029589D2F|nr:LysR family transcriptional regulator [Chakrabartyella piscis]